MEVIVGGTKFNLDKEQIVAKMHGAIPERVQTYGVKIHGKVYPCKQVLGKVTGLPRAKFNAHQAYRILERLGLPVLVTA